MLSARILGLLALVAACHTVTAAVDPYVITLVPALTPWAPGNTSTALQGGSTSTELNMARVVIGPCAYRMMHIHITADELLMLNTGRLLSYLVAPNNTVYKHTLTPGGNVVYPKGWMHYQYNPNCRPATCTLAFNAASVGTVNIPVALSSAPDEYFLDTYGLKGKEAPKPGSLWVTNAACLKRCQGAQAGGATGSSDGTAAGNSTTLAN